MIKNILIYIAGIITGAILMILFLVLISNTDTENNGITLFEKEGECISNNSFKVIQVLDNGNALANEIEGKYSIPTGITVLLLHNDTISYYDDQIIRIQPRKCAKQVGIFKYESKSGFEKTVPIVEIRDK